MKTLLNSKKSLKQLQADEIESINEFLTLFTEGDELSEGADMIMYCQTTGTPMYEIIPGRGDLYMSSHGKCIECYEYKSIDALRTSEGMSRSSWPIRYVGYTCKDCWDNLPVDNEPL